LGSKRYLIFVIERIYCPAYHEQLIFIESNRTSLSAIFSFYGTIVIMFSNPNVKKIKNLLMFTCLYLSLPLFIFFTNPQSLPLPLVILPVFLLFLIFYSTVYLLINKRIKRANKLSRTRLILISAIIAVVPVLLIVLASIQQFTLRDIILSAIIVISISWYLIKVDFLNT
jgi:drug/metabolite transporter (DMT)-like permease